MNLLVILDENYFLQLQVMLTSLRINNLGRISKFNDFKGAYYESISLIL